MITVRDLDFSVHGPQDIVNTGTGPLIILAELIDGLQDDVTSTDQTDSREAVKQIWTLNNAIHAGLKDVEAALYRLDRALNKKEIQAA